MKNEMNSFSAPADNLVHETRGYIDAQIDNVKLRAVKGLAQGTSAIAKLLLIFILLGAFLAALSFGLILLLGEILKSYALAAFIVSGVLLLVILLVVALRKVIFKNSFVAMYTDVFYQRETKPLGLHAIEDLDEAIVRGESRVKDQASSIAGAYNEAKEFYSPRRIMRESLHAMGLSNENGGVKWSTLFSLVFRLLFSRRRR